MHRASAQGEREREEEKRRGTRREGDGAANWSQTQFSAARAAQASHQKTRPTIIQAQTLNPKLSGAPVPGHEPASTCRFSGRGGWWPPANNNSASNSRSLFYTISRCSLLLYHEQVSSHTSALATTCSFSSSLPPRHTYAYTQSALKLGTPEGVSVPRVWRRQSVFQWLDRRGQLRRRLSYILCVSCYSLLDTYTYIWIL